MPADLHRERIGMMFIRIDAWTGPARSMVAAATTRTDWRRLVRGRQMSGGKGAKGGNLESLGNTGLADDVATRRKPAGTGGNFPQLCCLTQGVHSRALQAEYAIRLRKLRKLVSAGSGPVTAPRYGRSSGTPLTWRAPRGPARRTARAASETRMAQSCSLARLRLHVWNWSISE